MKATSVFRLVHEAARQNAAAAVLGAEIRSDRPIVVKIAPESKKRSLDQNGLSHVWYDEIADQLQEHAAEYIKRECKLLFGCPILLAESDDFRAFWNMAMKRLTYTERLEAMRFVPVTSIMTDAQMSRYLDDMQKNYASRVQLTSRRDWEMREAA